jgi:alkanesulfonate monooxygenase SsuD/methylene tetrahydromethanopterin reductase-like flavin-dependent oxidoreductase (luciferase family)
MVDVLSGGRLELGLGSGAYQREFDRMCPGVSQKDGHKYLQEMLPLVRDLWQGDVAHDGEYWQFPKATACPKPLQDKVPMWVAARSPGTFDYAVANDCNVMCWPLSMPMAEADKYKALLDEAIAKQGGWNGTFALMRHTAVYDNADDRGTTLSAVRNALGRFGNLMMKKGDVVNGFPDVVPLAELDGNARVDPAMLEENLVFGSPEQVIAKLKSYEALDVDSFIYYASMGLDMDVQKRSMSLFINEVMPEFA